MWILAGGLGLLVWRKHGSARAWAGVSQAVALAGRTLPRIVVMVLMTGLTVYLLPPGLVGQIFGPETGLRGIVLAMLVGGLIPAGASTSFPLMILLNEAGAGKLQLITLLTAWSVFAVHRVLIYEIPLMGTRFSMVRLLSSLPLPLTAAALASLMVWILPS